ncbi:MAG: hypothetical protein B7Y45_13190 [Sphingomonas sp. 28-66-16]|nr:MAG: hypothetical protein B7Y45_13190 [Sphingomonas sp. 28-66-16]
MTDSQSTPSIPPQRTGKPAASPARKAVPKLRETIGDGIDTARDAASTALDMARETAASAARRTADGIEGNPLSVLVGGLAVGVLAGALLPKTEREADLLGSTGRKLNEAAVAAARAARDAGKAELVSAGISSEAARAQAGKIVESLMSAARSAGDAAAKTALPEK